MDKTVGDFTFVGGQAVALDQLPDFRFVLPRLLLRLALAIELTITRGLLPPRLIEPPRPWKNVIGVPARSPTRVS